MRLALLATLLLAALANPAGATGGLAAVPRTGGQATVLRPRAGSSVTVDDNGNLTDDGSHFFTFDYKNRLVGAYRKSDGRKIAEYGYLADGRRVRKQVWNPDTQALVKDTRFVLDGGQEVEEQDWTSGATTTTYVWSPVYVDELVEFTNASGSYFAHQDARCDVVAVTNASGAVLERRRFDDFGRVEVRDGSGVVVAASPSGLDYGFQGRRLDPETGLVFFRARYYSPETGRFVQRDPVWDAGNVGGQYTFCGNGPASGRDAGGMQAAGMLDGINAAKDRWDQARREEAANPKVSVYRQGGSVQAASEMVMAVVTPFIDAFTLGGYSMGQAAGQAQAQAAVDLLSGDKSAGQVAGDYGHFVSGSVQGMVPGVGSARGVGANWDKEGAGAKAAILLHVVEGGVQVAGVAGMGVGAYRGRVAAAQAAEDARWSQVFNDFAERNAPQAGAPAEPQLFHLRIGDPNDPKIPSLPREAGWFDVEAHGRGGHVSGFNSAWELLERLTRPESNYNGADNLRLVVCELGKRPELAQEIADLFGKDVKFTDLSVGTENGVPGFWKVEMSEKFPGAVKSMDPVPDATWHRVSPGKK